MFNDFHGNSDVVHRLREMLARNHFPQAVILAGPAGFGQIHARAHAGEGDELPVADPSPTACPISAASAPTACASRSREDLDARFAEAVEARENLRETDKKETRLFVQTHPDVLVIPPDPPQMMIKVDQVRRVIETIYYRPGEARERVYIFTDSSFMKEAANSLLKVLEEPPEFATIFLLTENPGELLPTIRSRSMIVTLALCPPKKSREIWPSIDRSGRRNSGPWWLAFRRRRRRGPQLRSWPATPPPAPRL